MIRDEMLARLRRRREPWDLAVVGGGATGVGVAVDAASRGYAVALFEQADFGKGTSGRSTKLVHGGVRYLQQGDVPLVREALRERGRLRRNAPHLVHSQPFLVPAYRRGATLYYGLGLWAYDLLAGGRDFGRSHTLKATEVRERLPTLCDAGLRGGVLYHDGRFDDSRLLIHLARTAADHGAVLLNSAPVTGLRRGPGGRIEGLLARDAETGEELPVAARAVVNAAGPFCDSVRRLADPNATPVIVPSQGAHVVLPRAFLPGATALLVPRTPDGRVLFAIPWHGHVLVGTTDVPLDGTPLEPRPLAEEIDFILGTAGNYLRPAPKRSDVLSVFAGVRPLVAPAGRRPGATAKIARHHYLHVDPSGLVNLAGGKWTTYRQMAEDCVDRVAKLAGLRHRPCVTADLPVHGHTTAAPPSPALAVYGADAPAVLALAAADPDLGKPLHPGLPYLAAEVVWAARFELARTVEDVLARRTRALFLNARAAVAMAPRVAALLAAELRRDRAWADDQVRGFRELARGYQV